MRFTRALRRGAILGLASLSVTALTAWQSSNVFPDDGIPSAGGVYSATTPVAFSPSGASLDVAFLRDFAGAVQPPKRLGQSEFLESTASFGMSGPMLGAFAQVLVPADVTLRITNADRSGKLRDFELEVLRLDVRGPGFLLRESPWLPSLGRAAITRMPRGNFHVVSFLDVFLEVSWDDGASWWPATDPWGSPVVTRFLLTGP